MIKYLDQMLRAKIILFTLSTIVEVFLYVLDSFVTVSACFILYLQLLFYRVKQFFEVNSA